MSRFDIPVARAMAVVTLCASFAIAAIPAPAQASVTLDGAGSTWSSIAVDQWRADVNRQGLNVNYNAVGSTSGRVFYYSDQVDFAVSEIPFTPAYRDSTGTVVTNEIALAAHRPYAYLPIVAGGTSIMYHLDVGNRRITNLNLTPDVVAKIFTGGITRWNDPAIAATNPTIPLPSLAIRPVVRADGSGTSAQFTAFMANQTPSVWNAFCRRVGLPVPCPATSLYPEFPGSVAKQLSDGVAGFVAQSYNNGAITYVEYGYAKKSGFPVASVKNAAGYFIQPTAINVAIALQGARINADGTQQLQGVYTFRDPNTYPISSYSYMIVPTSNAAPFNTEKGAMLGKFILYFACAGQQKAAQLGYSPLPRNLVQIAFNAERRIPGAPTPPKLDAANCSNPTLSGSWPPKNVPPPPPPPPTTPTQTGGQGNTATTVPGGGGGTGNGSSGGSGKSTTNPDGTPGTNPDGTPATGSDGTALGGGSSGNGVILTASPSRVVAVSKSKPPLGAIYAILAVIFLLLVIFAPPTFAAALERRKQRPTS